MRAHAACRGGGPLSEMFKVILKNNNDQAYCYLSKVLFSSRISSYHFCFIVCFTRRSATQGDLQVRDAGRLKIPEGSVGPKAQLRHPRRPRPAAPRQDMQELRNHAASAAYVREAAALAAVSAALAAS